MPKSKEQIIEMAQICYESLLSPLEYNKQSHRLDGGEDRAHGCGRLYTGIMNAVEEGLVWFKFFRELLGSQWETPRNCTFFLSLGKFNDDSFLL